MKSLNQVTLFGNLGRDPVLRHTPSGVAVAELSLATSQTWKDRVTGNKKEHTDWHDLVAYRGTADALAKYARKGRAMLVSGHLETQAWEDANTGAHRRRVRVVVRDFTFIGAPVKSDLPDADQTAHTQDFSPDDDSPEIDLDPPPPTTERQRPSKKSRRS